MLVVFIDQLVLMVETDFGENVYYFWGGMIEAGRSGMEYLVREVREESVAEVEPRSISGATLQ